MIKSTNMLFVIISDASKDTSGPPRMITQSGSTFLRSQHKLIVRLISHIWHENAMTSAFSRQSEARTESRLSFIVNYITLTVPQSSVQELLRHQGASAECIYFEFSAAITVFMRLL
jgi:hypothetical protein